MATLTVRDLDVAVKQALRVRAATNGRSMEAEVRSILTEAVLGHPAGSTGGNQEGLGSRMARMFTEAGGVDLKLPDRSDPPRAADLG